MIYCFLIFQEEQKFPYALGIAFAVQVFLIALLAVSNLANEPYLTTGIGELIFYIVAILELTFVMFAIYLDFERVECRLSRRQTHLALVYYRGTRCANFYRDLRRELSGRWWVHGECNGSEHHCVCNGVAYPWNVVSSAAV